ncbi:putative efflux protein, MATE family [Succinivibrio dextrinosolvens]|uniref:MATE family efflux transporter n=1 Tax=Succinivibrio dextrinosolvens TaxID=83771 RepID=UPI0008EC5511|nr:MATE family efflux transporter [Succinivibrio dextrinosolvens]SFS82578.1 putative efflux protein, MATE family [Succinivibrio dextrinosolvens]
MSDTSPQQLASGPKHGNLFSLSWPIFIDLTMHFFTIIINTAMVSMLSLQAVAEMNLGGQAFQFAFTLFNFVNIGVCVCCAQAIGKGNKKMLRRIVHMSFGLNIVWGILITSGCFFGARLICDIMNIPEDIYETSKNYLMVLSIMFIAEAINLCCSSILRAYGRTRDPMYVNIAGNIFVIISNYALLFGHFGFPQMGIYGVAISAVIARFLSVAFLFYLMRTRTKIRIIPKFFFVVNKDILKQIFAVGIPGAGENMTWQLQFLFMTSVVGTLGSTALATHGIYMQMCTIIMLFSISIALGTEILISQYAGAMKLKLANKQLLHSVKIGLCITALLVINIPIWMGDAVLSIFTSDATVYAIARPIFYVSLIMEMGRILNIIIINSLRAVNDAKFPMFMAIVSMWGVSVPVGTFLSLYMGMGLLGVWIGFCCDECTRGLIMLLRWKSKAWVSKARDNYRKHYKTKSKKKGYAL